MTTLAPQPTARQAIDTILRVAGQLTDDQLRRLSAARTRIDDHDFAVALFRAHAVDPAAADAVDARLGPLVAAQETRHAEWGRDDTARMEEVVSKHPAADQWGTLGLGCIIFGTPLLTVAAAFRAVPWSAAAAAPVLGFLVLVVSACVLGGHLNRHTSARARMLGEAWRAVEGAVLACGAAHTVGQPGGLRPEEFELLTRPWSTQILPIPHITGA